MKPDRNAAVKDIILDVGADVEVLRSQLKDLQQGQEALSFRLAREIDRIDCRFRADLDKRLRILRQILEKLSKRGTISNDTMKWIDFVIGALIEDEPCPESG